MGGGHIRAERKGSTIPLEVAKEREGYSSKRTGRVQAGVPHWEHQPGGCPPALWCLALTSCQDNPPSTCCSDRTPGPPAQLGCRSSGVRGGGNVRRYRAPFERLPQPTLPEPRPQGAELYRKLCSFRVPCQAWGPAKGSILRNLAAMIGVPSKPTCPRVPVLPGFSFLLGQGRDQT